MSVESKFINACRLLSALPSLSQFGRGRLSLVAISYYALFLLFGPCRLSEFTLAGPQVKYTLWHFATLCSPHSVNSANDSNLIG